MRHNDVWYPSKVQHAEIASGKFGGDDAANERRGTEAASEENTFDAVTAADELNALHQVQYKAVQPRKSQVFSFELTCIITNTERYTILCEPTAQTKILLS